MQAARQEKDELLKERDDMKRKISILQLENQKLSSSLSKGHDLGPDSHLQERIKNVSCSTCLPFNIINVMSKVKGLIIIDLFACHSPSVCFNFYKKKTKTKRIWTSKNRGLTIIIYVKTLFFLIHNWFNNSSL